LYLCLTKHHTMKAYWGWMYRSTHSFTSALDGDEWSATRPGRFTPRKRAPGTHWIGGWVGCHSIIQILHLCFDLRITTEFFKHKLEYYLVLPKVDVFRVAIPRSDVGGCPVGEPYCLHFHPEDGSNKSLRNVDILPPLSEASNP